MQRKDIEGFLAAHGWQQDRFGHFKGVLTLHGRRGSANEGRTLERLYRIKLSARSARVEMQLNLSGGNEWVRVAGDCYTRVRESEGRLLFGSMWIADATPPGRAVAGESLAPATNG